MLDKLALILTIIGGINWGLIGIFQFDLVAWICGGQGSITAGSFTRSWHWRLSGVFPCCSGNTIPLPKATTPDKIKLRQMVCRSFYFVPNANRSEPNKRLNRNIPQNPESGQQKHQYPTKARVVPRVWQLIAASEYLNTVTKHGVAN